MTNYKKCLLIPDRLTILAMIRSRDVNAIPLPINQLRATAAERWCIGGDSMTARHQLFDNAAIKTFFKIDQLILA